MDKGIEAISEAIRRAPLTKPEGLSPEWQAYFDAVTPLHVADLIAALEQAQREIKRLSELKTVNRARQEAQSEFHRGYSCGYEAGEAKAKLEARPLCVKLSGAYIIRPGHPINEDERNVMIPKGGGNWFSRLDVEQAIRAAGGTVTGEAPQGA